MATSSGTSSSSSSSDHRDRQARGERADGGAEPGVEVERAQAPGDGAQLGDRGAELGDGLVEQPVHVEAGVAEVALRQPDGHAERDEPLLGAVVQVALQPSALPVARVQDPRAAVGHLAQRLGELQPGADQLDDQPDVRGDLPQQLPRRLGAHRQERPDRGVADVHRHPPSLADRQRRRGQVDQAGPARAARSPPAARGRAARGATCPPGPPGGRGRRRCGCAGAPARRGRPAAAGTAARPPAAVAGCATGPAPRPTHPSRWPRRSPNPGRAARPRRRSPW